MQDESQLATRATHPPRVAVIDLGSNSFRMVVFGERDGCWAREHEISRSVRVGEGLARSGEIGRAATERALRVLEEFAAMRDGCGLDEGAVDAVATSAIRDAENGAQLLEQAYERTGLRVRVLAREQEAHYAYLAAIHSTTLTDGCVLDLGGGSLQLVRVVGRLAREVGSWRMGAVRMTERFLPGSGPADPEQLAALRAHVERKLSRVSWLQTAGPRLVGLGGTVRNVAAALQRSEGLDEQVHGFTIEASALQRLVERLASMPVEQRGQVPGIKAARADIVLAGAAVVECVVRVGGFAGVDVTGAGLREGIFFERHLARRRLDTLLPWPRARAA
jgi:exopolyphosphatase / guanosine-5'-triphosphate,3'-diphosphate pyrophosphatase